MKENGSLFHPLPNALNPPLFLLLPPTKQESALLLPHLPLPTLETLLLRFCLPTPLLSTKKNNVSFSLQEEAHPPTHHHPATQPLSPSFLFMGRSKSCSPRLENNQEEEGRERGGGGGDNLQQRAHVPFRETKRLVRVRGGGGPL